MEGNGKPATAGKAEPQASLLCVDDDPSALAALARRLRHRRYRIVGTTCGLEACRLIEAESFDVVLLDICMPGMNGYDLLARIRWSSPDLPVIMLTALQTPDALDRSTTLGCTVFYDKTWPVEALLHHIEMAVARSRRQRRRRRFAAFERTLFPRSRGASEVEP